MCIYMLDSKQGYRRVLEMVYLQQFSARSWAIALSHCRSCRIGMVPTQYLNVKFGGLTVSRGHFRNISNAVCIPRYHSQLNYVTYSIKPVTPLFRKQKLSCLQHCVKFSSTSLMLRTPDSHCRISGVTAFPSVRKLLEDLNILPSSYQPGQYNNLMCPKCEGGSKKSRSLSVYIIPDGSFAMWHCHRTTCSWNVSTKSTHISVGSSTPELEILASENATSDVEVAHTISNGEVMDVISNSEAIALKYFTVENLQLEEIVMSFAAIGNVDKCNTSASKLHAKPQQTTKDNIPKRQKQMAIIPSSIIQICSTAHSNVFEGDIVALYGPGQNRHPGSPIKAQLLYADLVDKDGQLTITVQINNNFITRFIEHFSIGNSVRIKYFATRKKGPYCRGDANYAILLQEASSVENIPQVCKQRRLVPDSTIHELLASNNPYSVGSVAALVIGCQQSNAKFELKIKDGNTAADTTILQLDESYKDIFSQIRRQLQSKELPLYLFKNIVRNGLKGSQVLRSASSTFVDVLNDDFAKAHLLTFVKSKNQVQGLLKAKSVYCPPFQQFCDRCKQQLPFSSSECTICKQDTICKFEHNVDCTLETDDGIIDSILRMPQLQEFFPEITQTSFDGYLKSISSTVFHLRKIHLKGLFTLTIDNVITDIKQV